MFARLLYATLSPKQRGVAFHQIIVKNPARHGDYLRQIGRFSENLACAVGQFNEAIAIAARENISLFGCPDCYHNLVLSLQDDNLTLSPQGDTMRHGLPARHPISTLCAYQILAQGQRLVASAARAIVGFKPGTDCRYRKKPRRGQRGANDAAFTRARYPAGLASEPY